MKPPLELRPMTPADLPFADQLRALAGWNQTLDDWRRFLHTESGGCFVAEWEGQSAGTATTTVYGPELAWIGMVLVHPDHRRKGIGLGLLKHCIQYLRARGARCVKLDATPLGKKVYDNLGFQDEWTLSRWTTAKASAPPAPRGASIVEWRDLGGQRVWPLDREAFGVSRERIVQVIAAQSRHAVALETGPGRIGAFGMIRNGSRSLYLGPVAAASGEAGIMVVQALLERCQNEPVYWDIPDPNLEVVTWAKQAGFTLQRTLTRMYLGDNAAPGDPLRQIALAGPEIG